MGTICIIICFFFFFTVIKDAHLNELFWKDERIGVHVFDNLFPEEFPIFRIQLQEVTLGFIRNSNEDFLTLNGYQTRYIPRRYKTKYLLNLTKKAETIHPEIGKLATTVFVNRFVDRSDFNPVISRCSHKRSVLAAIVFLNDQWNKNDYGDIAIYNNEGEIITSFQPRLARVILMRCDTKYKINPPALRDFQELKLRYIEFTADPPKKISSQPDDIVLEDLLQNIKPNVDENDEEWNVDFSAHITRRIETSSKKLIYVFDHVVPDYMVDSLHTWVSEHTEYYIEIDFNRTRRYRGTNHLSDVLFQDFQKSPIWSFVKRVTTFVAKGVDTYESYDKFATHGRRMTHTFVHTDGITVDKEYTSVIYLNREWNPNMYGETIFLENNNLVTAIVPKYGRLVVFDGSIEHTSRPPSPDFNGARFSCVVKTSNDTKSAEEKSKRGQNCCPPWDPPIVGSY